VRRLRSSRQRPSVLEDAVRLVGRCPPPCLLLSHDADTHRSSAIFADTCVVGLLQRAKLLQCDMRVSTRKARSTVLAR